MNVLVIGRTGFVGSHVVKELLSRGHRLDGSAAEADFGYRYEWGVERQMRFLIAAARRRAGERAEVER